MNQSGLFSRMDIKHQLIMVVLIFVVGLGASMLVAGTILEKVKVNGPIYLDIVQGKDLVADILPPPEYIIESYLVILQSLHESDPARRPQYLDKFRKLKEEYVTRHDFWKKELGEGKTKQLLLTDSYEPAMQFYEIAEKEFFPALLKGDLQTASALAEGKLKAIYGTHRKVIDEIVTLANSNSERMESQARTTLTYSKVFLLVFCGVVTLVGVLVLSVLLRGILFDITERKEAERVLKQGKERLSLALDAANGGIWEWDLRNNEDFWSEELWKVFGLEPHSCTPSYKAWKQIVHPDDLAGAESAMQEAVRDGKELNVEWRLITHDGTERWIMSRGQPVRDSNGQVARYIGIAQDITERKLVEEELRESRLRQEQFFAFLPDATFAIDMEGNVIAWNRVIEEMTGISATEMLGKGDYEYSTFFYEKRRPLLADLVISGKEEIAGMYDILNKAGEKVFAEAKSIIKSGQLHYFSCIAAPLFDSEGNKIGAIEQIRDITELRLAEERLKESEERYRKLVELSPDAVYIHIDGILVFANAAGARLLGAQRPEELYGRRALDCVHPDYQDIIVQRLGKLLQNGEPNPVIEEMFIRLDGTNAPVEVSSLAFNYQGKEAVLVVAHDISERKKMQEEVYKSQKLESLGLLAGGIAHDFNNLLTGILGNLSLAKIKLDHSHKIARQIDECEKAAIRASDLAQQLLTFARGGEPVKKLIDASSLIRENTSFVLHGSNVRGDIRLADDLWCVEADRGQLSQVLHNILINAVQAMPLGGEVTVRAMNETIDSFNTCQLQPGDYIKIIIEDHGSGIPSENLARIFDPYFTTKPEGSGLGLASVYSIVRRHGGTVEASSTAGVGSSFTIHLQASSCTRPDAEVICGGAELVGNGRILIMDDEEIIRYIVTEILEFMGYDVETCSDGNQAVELFRSARKRNVPFNAVILDLTVPGGMGGRETAEHILEVDPSAVLIVSSGYSNDPVVANYRKYGFSGAVPKPFTADRLAGELERLLNRSSSLRPYQS